MTTLRPHWHPPSCPPSSTPVPTCSPGLRPSCLIGPFTSSPIHGLQPHAAIATASMRSAIVLASIVKPLRRVGAGDGNSSEKRNANDGHSTLPEFLSSLERQALVNFFVVSTLSPIPSGPRASRDMFTVLTSPPRTGGPGGTAGKGGKTSHLRPSRELRELVGIVGEMHAYRFLRHEFGSAAITSDAWISEIRLQVLPLVAGEPDSTSDSYGYDFRFTHRRTRLHVEVKATAGDETEFDLGISEIRAATQMARGRGGRWRILRVRQALSSSPEFDWLPNPFQEGFKQHFRLHKGGMRVSYRRKRA